MSGAKILTLAASFREPSLNKQLLALAQQDLQTAGATITEASYGTFDSPSYKAMNEPLPQGAQLFADRLLAHDGIVMAVPEYNWSIPGGLKNLIDWLSVDPRAPLNGKVALLMCASPSSRGGIMGLSQLREVLQVLGCWVYPQLIGIGKADAQLKPQGLTKQADQEHLTRCVTDFVRATNALKHAPA